MFALVDGADRGRIQKFKIKNDTNYSQRYSYKEMVKISSRSSAQIFNMISSYLCFKNHSNNLK